MRHKIMRVMGIVLLSVCLMMSIEGMAQNEGETGNAGDDPDIPNVPLDGGLSLLIGAGALYAGKRFKQWKENKSELEK